MYKIYLALGHKQLEGFIKSKEQELSVIGKRLGTFNDNVKFVGETSYREGILNGIEDTRPDLLILREGLSGSKNLTDLIYEIRVNYPNIRILFLAGDRTPGDAFLSILVQYNVYDIIIGSQINAKEVLDRIVSPNTFKHIAYLMPKTRINEKTNAKLFEAPSIAPVVQTIEIEHANETTENKLTPRKISEKPIEKKDIQEHVKVPSQNESESTQSVENQEPMPLEIEDIELELDIDKNDTVEKSEPVTKDILAKDNSEESSNTLNIKATKAPLKVSQKGTRLNRPVIKEKTVTPSESERSGLFGKLFGNKKDINKKVGQRILTFVGAGNGVGTSQIAFNTALSLAESGYKVMYMDLNDIRSSIESIFQLGFSDVGLDTALEGMETDNFALVERSIVKIDKILFMEQETPSPLYKTYSKLPKSLDYLFFSQNYIEKKLFGKGEPINASILKDLNMYLLTQEGYDFIILDAPSDMSNELTNIAIIYSMKLFFVITQDVSVVTNNINGQLKYLDKKGINYRDKSYYILNKSEPASWTISEVYKWLVEFIQISGLNMVTVPYIQKDFINANYIGVPITWHSKSKELSKSISDITNLALS